MSSLSVSADAPLLAIGAFALFVPVRLPVLLAVARVPCAVVPNVSSSSLLAVAVLLFPAALFLAAVAFAVLRGAVFLAVLLWLLEPCSSCLFDFFSIIDVYILKKVKTL
jgi:hypothetical protein